AEKGFIPIDTVAVLAQKEIRLFDPVWQAHMALEHFVQPRRAGTAHSDRDKMRQLPGLLALRLLMPAPFQPPCARFCLRGPGLRPSRIVAGTGPDLCLLCLSLARFFAGEVR